LAWPDKAKSEALYGNFGQARQRRPHVAGNKFQPISVAPKARSRKVTAGAARATSDWA